MRQTERPQGSRFFAPARRVNDMDLMTQRFPAPFPPPFADSWGDDEFGLWAEFTVSSRHGSATQRLRWIEPGSFRMGSPESEPERNSDEGPQHWVTLTRGFWLADTACTQALWQAVMGNNPSHFNERNSEQPGSPQHPVDWVSWNDVVLPPEGFLVRLQAFTAGAAAGLPSEAEWEYACRAGTRTAYSFGDTITGEEVNYWSDERPRKMTVAVRSLPANPWGLYEMHGNVWEWCADRYTAYPSFAVIDQSGSVTKEYRSLRGGSWASHAGRVRSAFRDGDEANFNDGVIGFRLALGRKPASTVSEAGETGRQGADREA